MPKFYIFHAIAIATLVSACSNSGGSSVGIPAKNTPVADATNLSGSEWLVGNWVPKGYSCQSDSGVEFKSDGTFASPGLSGRWTLVENTLTYFTTETDDVTPNPPAVEVDKLNPYPSTIRRVNNNEYAARTPAGKKLRLTRC